MANAHYLAIQALRGGASTTAYNLGNGKGFSVKEIISAVEVVTGQRVPVEAAPRRAGDPACLVASAQRIQAELGWRPMFPQIETIIQHAWRWRRSHPAGYGPS